MDNKFLYPVTKETFHKYAESIFAPIRRGECVTTVWVTMAGRRMWNKFLIENINLFEKELPNYNKYLLVYIEPLDLTEESLAGYIRLMAKSLIEAAQKTKETGEEMGKADLKVFNDPNTTYSVLLDGLRTLLKEFTPKDMHVVFFVGEFDELTFANKIFYNNLKSLWSGLYPRLHYVFLLRERVTRQQNITQWGELNEAILQNVVYMSLLSDKDFEYVMDHLSFEYKVELTQAQKDLLVKLCGRHPYLLKTGVRCIANFSEEDKSPDRLEEALLNYYELQAVSKAILGVRSDSEKKLLKLIAQEKSIPADAKEIVDFLLKIGLATKIDNNKLAVSGKIFKMVVLGQEGVEVSGSTDTGDGITIDKETGAIVMNKKAIEEVFTRQEYLILSAFLKNEEKLYSREEIGTVLWGKASYEKYSDWAIDQLVSKLRKKLDKLGTSSRVTTVRGRGYKLATV